MVVVRAIGVSAIELEGMPTTQSVRRENEWEGELLKYRREKNYECEDVNS